MRILQVIDIGFEAGGAEKSVRLIADGLTARGHQVRVFSTDLLADGQLLFAHDVIPAIGGNAARRIAQYFWYQTAYRSMRRVVRTFQPSCVHLHTISEFSPAILAATAGCRRLLTIHGPEDWTLSLLRWNLGSATGQRLSASDLARYAYLRFVQRPAFLPRLRRVDRVLVPSQFFAEAVRRDVGSVPVFVVPNGIERTTASTPVREANHVVFAGRLERVKGVDVLLDAFRRVLPSHPEAKLTIVGDGTDRLRLTGHAADLVAERSVDFRGWLSEADVQACLDSASVVVVPSLWPENFPTVALEALQVGRPLVASRVGGLPELVGDDNGALVPPGDVEALAAALRGLLGRPHVLERLGAASAIRGRRYDLDPFLDSLVHHYREVAA